VVTHLHAQVVVV
jgi:hypothetical protein